VALSLYAEPEVKFDQARAKRSDPLRRIRPDVLRGKPLN